MLTLVLYAPVRDFPFIKLDDADYVTRNWQVQAGLGWSTVAWAFTAQETGNWHPLTWLSHAADCQSWGLDPAAHHATNLLLHAVNALLLFIFLWRATGKAGHAWLVAALFAFHPINVESVAWVAERKNVLSMLFLLLGLLAYLWYVRKPDVPRYLLMAGLYACGLASKPMVTTFPCVLLLLDYWPLRRVQGTDHESSEFSLKQLPPSRLVTEKLPLFVLAAASSIITIVAQRAAGAVASIQQFSLGVRLENAVYAYALYLSKAVWPVSFALPYPHPGRTLQTTDWIVSLNLLLAASVVAWRMRRTQPYAIAGWLWFLGTMVPMIGIVQVGGQAMADRYAYLPLVGVFVLAVWGSADVCDRFGWGFPSRMAVSLTAVAALGFLTVRQLGYWRSDLDLWAHSLAVTTNNSVAEDNLGAALVDAGQYENAMLHFQQAARINPFDDTSYLNIGALLAQSGKFSEAIPEYEIAIRHSANHRLQAVAYCDLGTIYRNLGDLARSRENYENALRLDPQFEAARQGLQALVPVLR